MPWSSGTHSVRSIGVNSPASAIGGCEVVEERRDAREPLLANYLFAQPAAVEGSVLRNWVWRLWGIFPMRNRTYDLLG